MGKIVLHAGMPKTGSSSIQSWLAKHAERLRREARIHAVEVSVDASGDVQAMAYRGGSNSARVLLHYREHPEHRGKVIDGLFAQLDQQAHSDGVVVFSSEALATPLSTMDELFAAGLDRLASEHDVQVAYYVRPQHTALEAAWRQWGFRRDQTPAEYLAHHSRFLHHFETLTFVRDRAPRVGFNPRPFRGDLLRGESVVTDFAHNFLGVDAADSENVWENPGLPLDVVNALACVPDGLLWSSPHDNTKLERLKRLVGHLQVPDSPKARHSRLVLQQACHERFEDGNQRLIQALEWGTDEWVPPVPQDVGEASFDRLDELWRPRSSSAELAFLFAALSRALATQISDTPPSDG